MTGFNFTSTKDLETTGINIVVYGKSGTGKTSLAKTKDNLIIINFENGLMSLQGTDIPVFTPKSLEELNSFLDRCAVDKSLSFDTILVDSMTSLAEWIVAEQKKIVKDARMAYLYMQDTIYQIVNFLVGIKHLNVVFICQEARVEDNVEGTILKGPSFPGKNVGPKIPYLVDCVLHLKNDLTRNPQTQELVKSVYFVTSPTSNEEGKDRTGKLDLYEIPDLTNLFNKIKA